MSKFNLTDIFETSCHSLWVNLTGNRLNRVLGLYEILPSMSDSPKGRGRATPIFRYKAKTEKTVLYNPRVRRTGRYY